MAENNNTDSKQHAGQEASRSVSRVTPVPHRRLVTPGEAKKRAARRSRATRHMPPEPRIRFSAASGRQSDPARRAQTALSAEAAAQEARSEQASEEPVESKTPLPQTDAQTDEAALTRGEPPQDRDGGEDKAEKIESAAEQAPLDAPPEDEAAPEALPAGEDLPGAERQNKGAVEDAPEEHEDDGPAPQPGPEADGGASEASQKHTFRSARRVRLVDDGAQEKPARRKRGAVIVALFVLVAAGLAAAYFWLSAQPPVISGVDASDELNEDGTVTVTVSLRSANFLTGPDVWCALTDSEAAPAITDSVWRRAQDGVCQFHVGSGTFYLHAVDAKGNRSEADSVTAEANGVLSLVMEGADTTVYLACGDRRSYQAEVVAVGDADSSVTWRSSDPSVATVENGLVTAGETSGTAVITASTAQGLEQSLTVVVSDLIQLPQIIDPKTVLPSDRYTDEEAHLLDEILFSRVEEAGGYGTRGAVVAATRFLLLEFPYRISYFFENGRMTNDTNKPVCDGEGRFSHRGLYLCEHKFDLLEAVRWGPVIWGNKLINWQEEYQFVPGVYYPNGLDCSGFVCWCLVNGGYDFGDVGAGDTWRDDDLCDLGTQVPITNELMASGRVKAGDLIGKDGHIAIILGLDEENIYIAESLPRGVVVSTYKLQDGICYSYLHDYIMLMGEEYGEEGVYDNDPFAGRDA